MATQSISNKTWKNTFAPNVSNEYFTAVGLFTVVRYGRVAMRDLPDDAKEAVREIAREVYGE